MARYGQFVLADNEARLEEQQRRREAAGGGGAYQQALLQKALQDNEAFNQQTRDWRQAQYGKEISGQEHGQKLEVGQQQFANQQQLAEQAAQKQQERDQLLAAFDEQKDWRIHGHNTERDYLNAVQQAMRDERTHTQQMQRDVLHGNMQASMQQNQQEFQAGQQANQIGAQALMAAQGNIWQTDRDTRAFNNQLSLQGHQQDFHSFMAERQNAWQQDRDLVQNAWSDQHATLQADLATQIHSTNLNSTEQARLNRVQNAISEVQNDESLSPQERNNMITQLRTGIDPLLQRVHLAGIAQAQAQTAMQKQAAAAAARANALMQSMTGPGVYNPRTGVANIGGQQMFFNGHQWAEVPPDRAAVRQDANRELTARQFVQTRNTHNEAMRGEIRALHTTPAGEMRQRTPEQRQNYPGWHFNDAAFETELRRRVDADMNHFRENLNGPPQDQHAEGWRDMENRRRQGLELPPVGPNE